MVAKPGNEATNRQDISTDVRVNVTDEHEDTMLEPGDKAGDPDSFMHDMNDSVAGLVSHTDMPPNFDGLTISPHDETRKYSVGATDSRPLTKLVDETLGVTIEKSDDMVDFKV